MVGCWWLWLVLVGLVGFGWLWLVLVGWFWLASFGWVGLGWVGWLVGWLVGWSLRLFCAPIGRLGSTDAYLCIINYIYKYHV